MSLYADEAGNMRLKIERLESELREARERLDEPCANCGFPTDDIIGAPKLTERLAAAESALSAERTARLVAEAKLAEWDKAMSDVGFATMAPHEHARFHREAQDRVVAQTVELNTLRAAISAERTARVEAEEAIRLRDLNDNGLFMQAWKAHAARRVMREALEAAAELFNAIVANTESVETEPLTHSQGIWVTTIQCHAKVGAADLRAALAAEPGEAGVVDAALLSALLDHALCGHGYRLTGKCCYSGCCDDPLRKRLAPFIPRAAEVKNEG